MMIMIKHLLCQTFIMYAVFKKEELTQRSTEFHREILQFNQLYLLILTKFQFMEKYICENVFVPLRSAPTHRSEMLSQVLFGEKYVIADKAGTWIKIETLFDNYSGWIDNDHLQAQ